jgi:hypothetical protein
VLTGPITSRFGDLEETCRKLHNAELHPVPHRDPVELSFADRRCLRRPHIGYERALPPRFDPQNAATKRDDLHVGVRANPAAGADAKIAV